MLPGVPGRVRKGRSLEAVRRERNGTRLNPEREHRSCDGNEHETELRQDRHLPRGQPFTAEQGPWTSFPVFLGLLVLAGLLQEELSQPPDRQSGWSSSLGTPNPVPLKQEVLRNECVKGHNGASFFGWHSCLLGNGAANKTCQGSTQEKGLGVNLFQDTEQKAGELCSKLAQHPELLLSFIFILPHTETQLHKPP